MLNSIVFLIKTDKQKIALVNKIFEAMGHLAIVTTLDREAGILRVMCDPGSEEEVLQILSTLPCERIMAES